MLEEDPRTFAGTPVLATVCPGIGFANDFGKSLVMPHGSEWLWEYHGEDPPAEGQREALCTLGNGYFATRGRLPRLLPTRSITRRRMWRACTTGYGPR